MEPMMSPTPIERGIRAARKRAEKELEGFEPTDADLDVARELVGEALTSTEADWSGRAEELLSEVVAVAVFARSFYGDPEPAVEDVAQTAALLKKVFNSWLHD